MVGVVGCSPIAPTNMQNPRERGFFLLFLLSAFVCATRAAECSLAKSCTERLASRRRRDRQRRAASATTTQSSCFGEHRCPISERDSPQRLFRSPRLFACRAGRASRLPPSAHSCRQPESDH